MRTKIIQANLTAIHLPSEGPFQEVITLSRASKIFLTIDPKRLAIIERMQKKRTNEQAMATALKLLVNGKGVDALTILARKKGHEIIPLDEKHVEERKQLMQEITQDCVNQEQKIQAV